MTGKDSGSGLAPEQEGGLLTGGDGGRGWHRRLKKTTGRGAANKATVELLLVSRPHFEKAKGTLGQQKLPDLEGGWGRELELVSRVEKLMGRDFGNSPLHRERPAWKTLKRGTFASCWRQSHFKCDFLQNRNLKAFFAR